LGGGLGAAAVAAGAIAAGVLASQSSGHNYWNDATATCSAPCQVADFR
jgi:hypothetical protein